MSWDNNFYGSHWLEKTNTGYINTNAKERTFFDILSGNTVITLDDIKSDSQKVTLKNHTSNELLQLHDKTPVSPESDSWWGKVVTYGGNGGVLDFRLDIVERNKGWSSES